MRRVLVQLIPLRKAATARIARLRRLLRPEMTEPDTIIVADALASTLKSKMPSTEWPRGAMVFLA
jgi:hypothetical protein